MIIEKGKRGRKLFQTRKVTNFRRRLMMSGTVILIFIVPGAAAARRLPGLTQSPTRRPKPSHESRRVLGENESRERSSAYDITWARKSPAAPPGRAAAAAAAARGPARTVTPIRGSLNHHDDDS